MMDHRFSLTPIAEGNAGILQTAEILRGYLLAYQRPLRLQAEQILYTLPAGTPDSLRAAALFAWVQRHMEYTHDHTAVEEVRDPFYLLSAIGREGRAFGDCDDYVSLLGALYVAAGYPVRLVLVSMRPDKEYEHIYLRVQTQDGWIAADPIHQHLFGWEVPAENVTASKEISV